MNEIQLRFLKLFLMFFIFPMQIPPEHLLCASVMNAPCSLAVSKLLYPETEKSKITKVNALMDNKR